MKGNNFVGLKSLNIAFWFFLILFVSGIFTDATAQKTRKQLEKEKKDNLLKIKEAEKILSQTESEKQYTLGQLTAINRQVQVRESLIKSITEEINLIGTEIVEINIIIESLSQDLDTLKVEYAKMILVSYKASRGYDRLVFLFSAQTFNQFLMRVKYLEQYAKARKTQVQQIEIVKESLTDQKASMELKKVEKNELRNSQITQNRQLSSLKRKQFNIMGQLVKRTEKLKQEVDDRQKAIEKLDNLIDDLVRAEMERRKRSEATGKSVLSAEAVRISTEFQKNKYKLTWPVSSGFISGKFGKQPHPVLKGIVIENRGVDIQTSKNEKVKSVFEGEVATVAFVPGMNSVVLVRHGEFFTLYAKLKTVSVKKGDKIQANQELGLIFTDNEGNSELQFQVWKNTQKLNPEYWLKRK